MCWGQPMSWDVGPLCIVHLASEKDLHYSKFISGMTGWKHIPMELKA